MNPRLIIFSLALAGATLVAGTVPARSQPDPSAKPAESKADAILSRAESAADAALKWLRTRTSEAAASAEEAWKEAVVEANALAPPPPLGVFLYVPAVAEEAPQPERLPADLDAGAPTRKARHRLIAFDPAHWRHFDDATAPLALPSHLVILVHGLDEPGSIWNELAPVIHAAGLPLARFDYRNDGRIAAAADALGSALTDLHSRGVHRVDLVCHSMGGLAARDVLTRDTLYAGDARAGDTRPAVDRLILIGTPNRGSPWSGLRALAEIREQFVRWVDSDGSDPVALLGFLADGRGEAAADLEPGSAFLTELNARPLPRGVAITIIAGQLIDDEVAELQRLLDYPIAKDLLDKEQRRALAAGAADLRLRLGDGVVPLESARLAGVEDTVIVSANHRSVLNRWGLQRRLGDDTAERERASPAPAIPIILDRLQRE
jgi:hypothetical protein